MKTLTALLILLTFTLTCTGQNNQQKIEPIPVENEIDWRTLDTNKTDDKITKDFEPIPVDKEDGFYETVNYSSSSTNEKVQLADKPFLTPKDILEVTKAYNQYNKQTEISIMFTKDGARKFSILTKMNIGKPIPIVIANHIVAMPIVNSEIIGGRASISGGYTEKEFENMIQIMNGNLTEIINENGN